MKYKIAYEKFSLAYQDRHKVEFPLILKNINFKNKKVLEIGAGHQGYFPIAVKKLVKEYIAVDNNKKELIELKKKIKIKTICCNSEKIPLKNKAVDITIIRWLPSSKIIISLNEINRLTQQVIAICLPSEQGNETKLLEIKNKSKASERKQKILKIKKILEKKKFKANVFKRMLHFVFASKKEAMLVLKAVEFQNKLNKNELKKFNAFFEKQNQKSKNKKFCFTQGLALIVAKKQK